jgi:hypothetical protein
MERKGKWEEDASNASPANAKFVLLAYFRMFIILLESLHSVWILIFPAYHSGATAATVNRNFNLNLCHTTIAEWVLKARRQH